MPPRHYLLCELAEDIDRGKIQPLTSVKNIEEVIKEFVDSYESYEHMVEDLEQWNYVKLL